MPWYDVKYLRRPLPEYPDDEPKFSRDWCKTPASSKAEALETFTGYRLDTTAHELCARPLINEWDTRDRRYWYAKWQDAMAGMPFKMKQHYRHDWVPVERDTTPLPHFIEQRAKGKMRIIEGTIHQYVKTVISTTEYGRASALGILLGYITWTGADHKRKRANSCAMLGRKIPECSRPRDPKTRELLAKLGSMDRDEIKIMLAQKRKQMNEHD
jgi:hypothetical protein